MTLDFKKNEAGLLPAIIQDARSGAVLMLGYMNEVAFLRSLKEQRVTFYSRSKERLWTKGETSGHFLDIVEWKADCDGDTLLFKVLPRGPVCHTGTATCFGSADEPPAVTEATGSFLTKLESTIGQRFEHRAENSYVSRLAARGVKKIAQKVGEEAVELALEAEHGHREEFLTEAADLLFHFLVLLRSRHSSLREVEEVLRSRNK